MEGLEVEGGVGVGIGVGMRGWDEGLVDGCYE